MTAQQLQQMLTQMGVPADQVTALSNNAQLQAQLVAKAEYDAVQAERDRYNQELVGGQGRVGAREYQAWVENNREGIARMKTQTEQQAAALALYKERYGEFNNPNPNPGGGGAPVNGAGLTADDVKKTIQAEMNGTYGGHITKALVGTSKIVERHMRAQRSTEIDWDKIQEIAAQNGGNVELAYRIWDQPEAEKAQTTKNEAEIKRRIDEAVEVERGKMLQSFPAGGDVGFNDGPSPLSRRTGDAAASTYDRGEVLKAFHEADRGGSAARKNASAFFKQ